MQNSMSMRQKRRRRYALFIPIPGLLGVVLYSFSPGVILFDSDTLCLSRASGQNIVDVWDLHKRPTASQPFFLSWTYTGDELELEFAILFSIRLLVSEFSSHPFFEYPHPYDLPKCCPLNTSSCVVVDHVNHRRCHVCDHYCMNEDKICWDPLLCVVTITSLLPLCRHRRYLHRYWEHQILSILRSDKFATNIITVNSNGGL